MAKYTVTIKSLIQNNFDFKLTDYPIFDELYRPTLNHNILYHYFESEIGFETAALFRLFLNQRLMEIMPYYNNLYLVQKKLIDENLLLSNLNISESLSGNDSSTSQASASNSSESSSSASSNSASTAKNLFQDTPQGQISSTDITNQTWATNLTLDSNSINSQGSNSSNSSNNTSQNQQSSSTNSYIKTIIGNNGNKYNIDLLNDIKNKLMSIDLLIINDLYDLFMQIF